MATISILPLLFCLLGLTGLRPTHSQTSTAWLLPEQYEQIVYSSTSNVFVGLRSDGRHVDTLSVEQRQVVQSFDLPLPSYLMAVGANVTGSDVISAVHNSYVSFIRPGQTDVQTFFFPHGNQPIRGMIGGVGENGLTCLWENFDGGDGVTSEIVCIYPEGGQFVECPHSPEEPSDIGDSFPLVLINGSIIYVFNPADSLVLKYVVGAGPHPDCPTFLRSYRPTWGVYGTPRKAWASIDGSRLFLDNGLTLTASEDERIDMRERGSFDGGFARQSLESVAQSDTEPFTVYAYHGRLEAVTPKIFSSVDPGVVASYSFPFLEQVSLFEVPPPNSSFVVAGEESPEAYIRLSRNDNVLYVVTNYTDAATKTNLITGIATLPINPE